MRRIGLIALAFLAPAIVTGPASATAPPRLGTWEGKGSRGSRSASGSSAAAAASPSHLLRARVGGTLTGIVTTWAPCGAPSTGRLDAAFTAHRSGP
jgi:hypothetical protein